MSTRFETTICGWWLLYIPSTYKDVVVSLREGAICPFPLPTALTLPPPAGTNFSAAIARQQQGIFSPFSVVSSLTYRWTIKQKRLFPLNLKGEKCSPVI
jgi:hypothetical protein